MQVLNIRNVSAPKAHQESKTSPRLLQLDLTDGQAHCSGLEMEHISSIGLNTAPGTKVVVKSPAKFVQGMILFSSQNISVIGGHVEALHEKWEINRTLAKYAQGARRPTNDGNGPPPWILFGQKISQNIPNDKSFKSLGAAGGDKSKDPSKENTEFITTRNEAIAEAAKIGTKKIFGGGNRQLIDYNVKKILDKGYTEEQAKLALKLARNNLERAMSSLKRQNASEDERNTNETRGSSRNPAREERSGGGRRATKAEAAEIAAAAKPTGKVQLYDYLEDKIKIPATVQEIPSSSNASTSVGHSHGALQSKQSGKQGGNHVSHNYKQNSVGGNPSNSRYNSRSDSQHQQNTDNRSKFENNISSSFANRQRKDDNMPYQKTNNYNSNRPNKWPAPIHSSSLADYNLPPTDKFESGGGGNSGFNKKPTFPPFPSQQQQQQQQQHQSHRQRVRFILFYF